MPPSQAAPPRLHYAWVVAGVAFLVLLITAGVRATPGILMVPLEGEFGWSRTAISGAIAINIALFGLIGPFAASVTSRFDILGTTASGWLTDRCSSRHLAVGDYTLHGISLLFLPATLEGGAAGLGIFAVFYGLDWIATVPPTVRLTTEAFGRASMAAFGAGAIRTQLGDYNLAFWIAGVLCVLAGLSFLTIGKRALAPPLVVPATA